MAQWTFGRKVGVGFAVAGIVTAVVAVVGYRSTSNLVEADEWVDHTYQVRLESSELFSRLKEAESAARGFAITGREEHVATYGSMAPAVEANLARLRTMTVDDPIQRDRVEALKPLIDKKFAILDRHIVQRRSGGLEAATASVITDEGRQIMESMRQVIGDIQRVNTERLDARRREAAASASTATDVMLWGAVVGTLLVVAIGWLITRSLSQQIGEAVRHVQSSSTELHAAASQQAAGSKEQATAMSQITTTISELLATSRQIAESAQRVAQIASETAGSARTGTNVVDRAQESVGGIRRQVDLIVTHMLELGKSSQQIGAVLDIVTELAEQTNILAINATIEAAGAGEAGKRFAVVADEIRKLADRVGASTKEIRNLIDSVRSSVNTTVMATETGSKAVDAGGKQFGEVASAFRQIAGLVGTTTEAAREIELSTKQQSTAVEQVNLAIANVGQASRETEASATQTQETAAQLSRLSKDLLRVVQATA